MGNRSPALDVLGQLAAVTADGAEETLVLDRQATIEIDRLGDRDVAITAAVDDTDLIADQTAGQFARSGNAPVGRCAQLVFVHQFVFDIAVAVDAFDIGHPGGVCRAHAEHQGLVKLGLHKGLLDVKTLADVADRADRAGAGAGRGRGVVGVGGFTDHVADIGGDVGRPHIVELVVNAQVKALEVEAGAVDSLFCAIRLGVEVRCVEEHRAADFGVTGPGPCANLLFGGGFGGLHGVSLGNGGVGLGFGVRCGLLGRRSGLRNRAGLGLQRGDLGLGGGGRVALRLDLFAERGDLRLQLFDFALQRSILGGHGAVVAGMLLFGCVCARRDQGADSNSRQQGMVRFHG